MDNIFDTLNGAQYFSSLDLALGYWQVELDDAHAKSAFTTYNGLFEFVRMPFGLCNTPQRSSALCRLCYLDWRGRAVSCTWMTS